MRPLQTSDAPALLAIFSDPRVMRYGSTPAWTRIEQAGDKIGRNQRGMAAGESLCLAVLRKEDQQLLGTADLFEMDEQSQRAELGYTLAFDAWGKGYMSEALSALLDYSFGQLKLRRLEADIDPRNTASANLLARLGFQQEGLLRERWIVGDEISDSAIYGLLAREWLERQVAQ
jgi:RimJ/RimL family protein N-acetyltransferase